MDAKRLHPPGDKATHSVAPGPDLAATGDRQAADLTKMKMRGQRRRDAGKDAETADSAPLELQLPRKGCDSFPVATPAPTGGCARCVHTNFRQQSPWQPASAAATATCLPNERQVCASTDFGRPRSYLFEQVLGPGELDAAKRARNLHQNSTGFRRQGGAANFRRSPSAASMLVDQQVRSIVIDSGSITSNFT